MGVFILLQIHLQSTCTMAEGRSSVPESDSQVISGVIDDVRQSFLDSGMDLETLAKLEKLWISKLCSMDEPKPAVSINDEPGPIGSRDNSKKMETEGEAGLLNTEEEAINEEDGSSETEEKDLPVHVKKVKKLKKNIDQVDGTADSSEEDEVEEDDDDDDVEEDDEDDSDSDLDPDGNSYDGGVEMDPPGSGDDNSDEEASELFDTENVVVCQYDL